MGAEGRSSGRVTPDSGSFPSNRVPSALGLGDPAVNNARPTHYTEAGSAYLRLRRIAHQQGRFTEEYLRLYVLECFLARLAVSPHVDRLVVKGGVLLAAYAMRR